MHPQFSCLLAATLLSCSSNATGPGPRSDHGNREQPGSPDASVPTGPGGAPEDTPPPIFIDASRPTPGPADAQAPGCRQTASAEAALEPVHLAFAFDVSGSMGKLDFPYHDPKLKWEPVVAAAKGFFGDPASANMTASLVFFPIDASESKRCDPKSYATPDVPVTPLPSDAFAKAIDAVTPKSTSDWRGGTPTLAVVKATIDFITPLADADPNEKHAMVLVTDGYPQGCSDSDDKIDSVVAVVKKAAPKIPTYVIGVANPPGGPDTVTNLNDIAKAGGTDGAFIIMTGDPAQTVKDFQAAVRTISTAQVSCDFAIPPAPAGQSFDPTRANVTYSSEGTDADLVYDAECKSDLAWRFDDTASPHRMVLCDATCTAVRDDPTATLRVDFGCARRDVIR